MVRGLPVVLLAALLTLAVPGSARAQHLVVGIRVGGPPPAVRVERVPAAPSPRHAWVPGWWWWDGARYVWRAGAWMVPPAMGVVWVPPSWHFENGQWTYYPGYWSSPGVVDPNRAYQPAPPAEPDIATSAPPPPLTETQPPAPFDGAAWIPGYWYWGPSGYVWVGGRWSVRPRGWDWDDHRWVKRDEGHWERRPGHWHPHEGR